MKKEDLKKMTIEELKEKEKNTKVLIGIYVPIILGLGYFVFRDYTDGGEFETTGLIIWICALGGMASLFPNLKMIREELTNR